MNIDVPSKIKLIYNQIISCLDFCNILLLGASDKDIRPLKLMLNRAIRFVFSLGIRDHITPHYRSLGLLPIRERIIFKACIMAHKIFYNSAPIYLCEKFDKFKKTTNIKLRETSGRDAFMFHADLNTHKANNLMAKITITWNTLPYDLRKLESVSLFKSKLKTKLLSEI